MKAQKVIYGVPGMLEYQTYISIGKARVKVSFTNGTTNESGRTPASFCTTNLMLQHAIEGSPEFKSGKIQVILRADTDEDVYIESEHVALSGGGMVTPAIVTEEPAKEENKPTTINKKTVEVAELDEAREYLVNEFGYKVGQVRTKAQIAEAAARGGIEFIGITLE